MSIFNKVFLPCRAKCTILPTNSGDDDIFPLGFHSIRSWRSPEWSLVRAIRPAPLESWNPGQPKEASPFAETYSVRGAEPFCRDAPRWALSAVLKKNLSWRCPNQSSVSAVYSRPQRAASFLHLNSTLPQSRVAPAWWEGITGKEEKLTAALLTWDLRYSREFWKPLCSLQQRHHFQKYYSFDFALTQGFCDISAIRLKARRFDSNKAFKTENLHCFSVDWLPGQGLICTRPNIMALRAPFAAGSSPSNETFWLCLPTLLLGTPWVACSYSVVFSFLLSLPSLTHSRAGGTPIPFCWEGKAHNYLKRLRQYAQPSPFTFHSDHYLNLARADTSLCKNGVGKTKDFDPRKRGAKEFCRKVPWPDLQVRESKPMFAWGSAWKNLQGYFRESWLLREIVIRSESLFLLLIAGVGLLWKPAY